MMFILFVYFHFIAYFSWFLKEMVRKLSNILGPLGLSLPWINLVYKDNNCAFTNYSELYKYDAPGGAHIFIFCKVLLYCNQCAAVLCTA